MQANPSPPAFDEREGKQMQRALLALLLHEFPTQLTRASLSDRLGSDIAKAVRVLASVELVWCEGDFVLPTLAARHFDWLELP
jgi:hypothetical protein